MCVFDIFIWSKKYEVSNKVYYRYLVKLGGVEVVGLCEIFWEVGVVIVVRYCFEWFVVVCF